MVLRVKCNKICDNRASVIQTRYCSKVSILKIFLL